MGQLRYSPRNLRNCGATVPTGRNVTALIRAAVLVLSAKALFFVPSETTAGDADSPYFGATPVG